MGQNAFRYILTGLLSLVALIFVFNKPGIGNLELFHYREDKIAKQTPLSVMRDYPPLVYSLFSKLTKDLPSKMTSEEFYATLQFATFKIIIFIAYLLLWGSMALFGRGFLFLLSFPILLSSLGHTSIDILAITPLIYSLWLLKQKRASLSGIFYVTSLLFSWVPLILSPLFLIYINNNKEIKKSLGNWIYFLVIPTTFTILLSIPFIAEYLNRKPFPEITTNIFGLPWLMTRLVTILSKMTIFYDPLIFSINLPNVAISIFGFSAFFFIIYKVTHALWEKLALPISTIGLLSLLYVLFPQPNLLAVLFGTIFLFLYSRVIFLFWQNKKIDFDSLLTISSVVLFLFSFFFPYTSDGNLIFLICILILTKQKSLVLITNLLVFLNIFYLHGTNGYVPFKSAYASVFNVIIFGYFSILTVYITNLVYKSAKWLNALVIGAFIITSLYFFGAPGTSDTVSWSIIFRDTIGRGLFEAHAFTDNIYPPLSTFIMSFFAHGWNLFFKPDRDYIWATKFSILFFYLAALLIFIVFHKLVTKGEKLSIVSVVLIFLTTISLAMNSLSLTYVDFYIVPFVALSYSAIYLKKFFLAGLMLSIAALTKWQPAVLLPPLLVMVYNTKKGLFKFLAGFFPLYILVWSTLAATPGGLAKIIFSVKFFLHPPNLSGNAQNAAWILTYFLHIFDSATYGPLRPGGLNWLIRAGSYPSYTVYLFYAAIIAILVRFWLIKNKTLPHLLTTSMMFFFSHYILNRGVHEGHLFYTVILALLLYLSNPTSNHRRLLIVLDIMNFLNLVIFYGFIGNRTINPLFMGIDLTVLFATYNVLTYLYILRNYLKSGDLS